VFAPDFKLFATRKGMTINAMLFLQFEIYCKAEIKVNMMQSTLHRLVSQSWNISMNDHKFAVTLFLNHG
jgi:hypothetical protein